MKTPTHQQEFPFAPPRVVVPTTMVPQPGGGWLITQGKPIVVGDEVKVAEFARLTGISHTRVVELCVEGIIASRRLTPSKKSPYLIPRYEIERILTERKIETR
jgi:hypothetical protein